MTAPGFDSRKEKFHVVLVLAARGATIWAGRVPARRSLGQRASFRPRLEALEDRKLLSASGLPYPTAAIVSQLTADINYADKTGGAFTFNLKPSTTFGRPATTLAKGQLMKTTKLFAILLATLVATSSARAATIDMVPVGNPGNAPDTEVMFPDGTTGYGSVGYVYQIGKYEVTAGQYTEFLNAVAKADPNGLYNTAMGNIFDTYSGANIQQTGSSPNFSYSVAADWANRPVNYVSFWDAARFANWLHNGQPTGAQGPATTEGGAYHDVGNQTLFGRNAGARFFIPTENEWYKAAYHKNDGVTGNYWDYPTASDTAPINTLPDPGGNHANFFDGGEGAGNNGSNGDYTIGSPYYRTNVGEFANSASPYGAFDQGGNVAEWNETAVTSSTRGRRGGTFGDRIGIVGSQGQLASARFSDFPTYEGSALFGFRVASIPEPSSLTLSLAGVMMLSLWRRKK